MSEKQRIKSAWSFARVIEWLAIGGGFAFLAVFVYGLSIGPAMRIAQATRSDKSVIVRVYQPVILLTETPVKPYLKWYLDFWGVR
jgi:hypothetical protein